MKRLVVLSAVVAVYLVAIPLGHAQSGGMKGMDMKDMDMSKCKDMMGMEKGMDMNKCMDMMGKGKKDKGAGKKSEGRLHKGIGTVEKIDSTASIVTIAHGPVQSLKWPSMTMSFGVKDKAMLEQVKPGAKVEFEFVQSGKDYLITEIK